MWGVTRQMQMNAALCQGHTCVSATSPIQQIKAEPLWVKVWLNKRKRGEISHLIRLKHLIFNQWRKNVSFYSLRFIVLDEKSLSVMNTLENTLFLLQLLHNKSPACFPRRSTALGARNSKADTNETVLLSVICMCYFIPSQSVWIHCEDGWLHS